MNFVRLTPRGKVVFALWDAPRSFGDLKVMTGLSRAWLSRTLKLLYQEGIIEHDISNRTYLINKTRQLQAQAHSLVSVYLTEAAERVAKELAHDDRIISIILFGSVARGEAIWKSDVDLLIVLKGLNMEIQREFIRRISELRFKFDISIEPVMLGSEDFEGTLKADVGLIFGLARGYEVLHDDDTQSATRLLDKRVAEIRRDYSFVEEGEIWLPKKGITAKA